MIELEPQVLLYGGGGFGAWVSSLLREVGTDVVGVIDRDPGRCTWAPAIGLTEAKRRFPAVQVIVAVFSPQPDVTAIQRDMHFAGFRNTVTPPQLFESLGHRGVDATRYWLTTNRGLYREHADDIARARELLTDEESLAVFDDLLAYRLEGDSERCPRPRPLIEQHTGLDFAFLPTNPGLVVDCGAFTGDTFANWVNAGLVHDRVLALEPDDASFAVMVEEARTSRLRVIPMPIGVTESTGRYRVEGSGASATLERSEEGPTVAMSLDDLLPSPRVTLVKMDIEGGEAGALRGGHSMLERDRPHLAISVYHKPWHLWSIANWLDSAVGGYQFRLRVYGYQGYDTVLYGTPTGG